MEPQRQDSQHHTVHWTLLLAGMWWEVPTAMVTFVELNKLRDGKEKRKSQTGRDGWKSEKTQVGTNLRSIGFFKLLQFCAHAVLGWIYLDQLLLLVRSSTDLRWDCADFMLWMDLVFQLPKARQNSGRCRAKEGQFCGSHCYQAQ